MAHPTAVYSSAGRTYFGPYFLSLYIYIFYKLKGTFGKGFIWKTENNGIQKFMLSSFKRSQDEY